MHGIALEEAKDLLACTIWNDRPSVPETSREPTRDHMDQHEKHAPESVHSDSLRTILTSNGSRK